MTLSISGLHSVDDRTINEYGAFGVMKNSRGIQSTRVKPAPLPLYPLEIPHDLIWRDPLSFFRRVIVQISDRNWSVAWNFKFGSVKSLEFSQVGNAIKITGFVWQIQELNFNFAIWSMHLQAENLGYLLWVKFILKSRLEIRKILRDTQTYASSIYTYLTNLLDSENIHSTQDSMQLINTVTCRVVRVTKITGSRSDDWIY
jgi:hypothetical protein